MFGEIWIAPSILSGDFMNMERDIRMLEASGADIIHVDVMDGHFVPNLTIGVPFVKQLRKITDLPIDVHLMISNPAEQIDWFLDADPDFVSVHIEAMPDEDALHALLAHIRSRGIKPALALKPDMPISALDPFVEDVDMILVMSVFPGFSGQSYIEGSEDRVAQVASLAKERNPSLLIEVDGGISPERTAGLVCSCGADVLVAGSGVFAADVPALAVSAIRDAGKAAQAFHNSATEEYAN